MSKKLADVIATPSPARAYKLWLQGMTPLERQLVRLEQRYKRNPAQMERWEKAVTLIQTEFRAYVERKRFAVLLAAHRAKLAETLWFDQALEAFDVGDYEECLSRLAEGRAKAGVTVVLGRLQGQCLYRLCRLDEALVAFEEVLALAPKDVVSLRAAALLHARDGDVVGTFQLCLRLLDLEPDDYAIARLCGLMACKLKKWHEAIAQFTTCIDGRQRVAGIHVARACGYIALHDWQKAAADLSQGIRYKSLPEFLCLRARTNTCMRQWKVAQLDYEHVLSGAGSEMGQAGLDDVLVPREELPMLKDDI